MNTQINRFTHVMNRYNNPIFKTETFYKLEMDFAMKSINLEKEKFTNYVKTRQSEQYKLLLNIYSDYKKGKNILEKFEAYDVELYSKNTKRLSEILTHNNMKKYSEARTSNVLIYHFIGDNKKLRLYIEKDKNNNLSVKLIDLHHLAIPSRHKGTSAEIMKERIYNQHKSNRISIGNIKSEVKEQE